MYLLGEKSPIRYRKFIFCSFFKKKSWLEIIVCLNNRKIPTKDTRK